MPRVGPKEDWSLTLAIDGDLKELPKWLEQFLESDDVTRYCAVSEKAAHWHIHVGFSTRRSYNSDYTGWFLKLCKDDPIFYDAEWCNSKGKKVGNFRDRSIKLHAHNDLLQLVGGYCAKNGSDDLIVHGDKGFTEDQYRLGQSLYDKSLKRKRIREAMDRLVSIPREHFDATTAYAMEEAGLQEGEEAKAVDWLVDAGFAFSSSLSANDRLHAMRRYRANYAAEKTIRNVRPRLESDDEQNDMGAESDGD